ncbi:hypothetical protein [Streptomyces venezuelae]|uniref:hypothetical protein n=1 Tax=Streptomyces venezuelae TaxID=54571 RepID=UPI000903036F|nr:hypothetical protein [Streptomyces venezuelae]APE26753.1 hypothetical protein vnz_37190 [Streptomyces venezuelae]
MTKPDHDLLWTRCALLGRVLLPMVDQDPWRQTRRHDNLRAWGIGIPEGERLMEVFTALAARAAAEDASLSAAGIGTLSLHAVADAATGKADIELLASLPDIFAEAPDQEGAVLFRLYAYQGGQAARHLFQLGREVRRALLIVAELSLPAPPTYATFLQQAATARIHGDP